MKENHNECAVITAPGEETFHEFVLFAHNGIRLLDKDGVVIKTTEQDMEEGEGGHGAPDHEDTGEKGYNYRSERFFNRLKRVPIISKVFDSKTHGDPATPLFCSYVGERVKIRLLMPADKPRNIQLFGSRSPPESAARRPAVKRHLRSGRDERRKCVQHRARTHKMPRRLSLPLGFSALGRGVGKVGDYPRDEAQYPLPLRICLPPRKELV